MSNFKLKTGTILVLEGHSDCAKDLEDSVGKLLLHTAALDNHAQQLLLQELEPVFPEADNVMLTKLPEKIEIKETLDDSNLHAAPGTDGITSFLYKECWDTLKETSQPSHRELH